MASKEFTDLKGAVESLKLVAENYHVAFDTSEFDRAFRALKKSLPSDVTSDDKPKADEKPSDAKPQKAENPGDNVPRGVIKDPETK